MSTHNYSGHTFGQYELREILGIGGMGTVYRAYQTALRRTVAVKVLSPGLATDPDYIQRFHHEAETAAALEHPHIVPVYDYGVQDGVSYIVMRLLTGDTLAQRLARREETREPLPALSEIADLLNQLAGAFDYAHARGVIHRDIKPSNIMFDNQGNAFLVDFGIARLLSPDAHGATATGAVLGSPSYMAPEQWEGEPLVSATDQYALGVTVYQLIVGQVPFKASSLAGLMHSHLNETATPPHLLCDHVPEAVSITLARAMSRAPAERFPTVTAFAQAFEQATAGVHEPKTGFFVSSARPTPLTSPAITLPPDVAQHLAETQGEHPGVPPEKTLPNRLFRNPLVWLGGLIISALAVVLILSGGGEEKQAPVAEVPTATATAIPPTSAVVPTTGAIVVLPSATPAATETPTRAPTQTATATPDLDATVQVLAVQALTSTAQGWTAIPPATQTPVETAAPPVTPTTPVDTPDASTSATPGSVPSGLIAFVSDRDGLSNIYVTDLSGENVTCLTFDQVHTDSPDWSPDGSRIVFSSDITGNDEIYVMKADGGDRIQLTDNSYADRWPAWSPDGRQIVFMSDREGNADLYLIGVDDRQERRLTTDPAADRFPAWSPDGSRVVFQSEREDNRELYIMTITEPPDITRLTRDWAEDRFAAWSPDGRTIAFQTDRDGNSEIYLIDVDGSHTRNVTNHPAEDRYPAWSPDGSQLVFQSERDGNRELYIMNADGSDVTRLTTDAGNDWKPAWQPD
jgi:Tol biopolymer transport system component/serine/threonine protein kinase